jgi:hypothetical protein
MGFGPRICNAKKAFAFGDPAKLKMGSVVMTNPP